MVKQLRSCLRRILVLLSALFLFVSMLPSYAAYWYTYPTRVEQEYSLWCWVASAEMVGKHLWPSSTRTQESAFLYVKGYLVDETGLKEETAKAAKYFTHNNYSFTVNNSYLSLSSVKNLIDKSMPFVASAGYYENGLRIGGHSTVIMGYGTGSDNNMVAYIDPWPDEIGPGANDSFLCPYSEFIDGSFNDREWDGTVYPY